MYNKLNSYLYRKGDDIMLAVNYSTIGNNLKMYCDEATDHNETVIVTRKGEKNVVVLSLEKYNQITKAAKNAEYLAMEHSQKLMKI